MGRLPSRDFNLEICVGGRIGNNKLQFRISFRDISRYQHDWFTLTFIYLFWASNSIAHLGVNAVKGLGLFLSIVSRIDDGWFSQSLSFVFVNCIYTFRFVSIEWIFEQINSKAISVCKQRDKQADNGTRGPGSARGTSLWARSCSCMRLDRSDVLSQCRWRIRVARRNRFDSLLIHLPCWRVNQEGM